MTGQTLGRAFARTVERHGERDALRWRTDGGWRSLQWAEYREDVRALSLGLRALDLTAPSSVAVVLARNGPRHVIADLAIGHARAVPVTAYNTMSSDQLQYLLEHSQATVALVEAEFLDRLPSVRSDRTALAAVVVMDVDHTDGDGRFGWETVREAGRALHRRAPLAFDEAWGQVQSDDPATLIYTSGTSGPPKAVIHTQRSVLWTLESLGRMAQARPDDRLVSYLPLAHSAERWWSHWRGVLSGALTSFCPDPALLLPTLLDVRPTWFLGVPRIWEKLHAGITAELARIQDPVRRQAVLRAVEVGRHVVRYGQEGGPVPPDLRAEHDSVRPILASVLRSVGLDHCRVACAGSAPVSTEVLELFHALGLPVSEGWGMTEMMVGTWNGTERIKIGTVGIPLPGVEARLADDGELFVRGGHLAAGYYKDPEATSEVFGRDGWLQTGDVAAVDCDGYYRIVDRKKDLIITAGGKNISPANMETLMKRHPLVDQACVAGEGRPYLVALIVLGPAASAWATSRGLDGATTGELACQPAVVDEVASAVAAANEQVSRPEQIKRFHILPEEWSIQGGELTPTFKLRRRIVLARHAALIDDLYAADQ